MESIKTRRVGIGILVVIMLVMAVPAWAANRVWDGGGADSEWDTTGNWNPDGYSDSDDLLVLSGTPTNSWNVHADDGGSITLNGSAAVARFTNNLQIAYSTGASGSLNIT